MMTGGGVRRGSSWAIRMRDPPPLSNGDALIVSARIWDAIVDRLRAGLGELADAMLARYRAEVAPYLDPRDVAIPGERAAARVQVGAFLDAVAGGVPFPERALATLQLAGMGRARARVPLPALLRGCEEGVAVLWKVACQEIEAMGLAPETRAELAFALGARLLELQRQVIRAVAEAYVASAPDADRLQGGQADSLSLLLADSGVAEDALRARAVRAGVSIAESYLAARIVPTNVALPSSDAVRSLDRCTEILSRLRLGDATPTVEARNDGAAAVFPVTGDTSERDVAAAIETALGDGIVLTGALLIGLGRVERGLAGISRSYRQARWAVEAGIMGVRSSPAVTTYGRALPRLLVAGRPELAADVYRFTIQPLRAHDARHGTSLVATLRALLAEDWNLMAAAGRLFVHRNTLRARVERIEALTAMSLDRPADLVLLALGLHSSDLTALES